MKRVLYITLIGMLVSAGGCATSYVAHLRHEYSHEGKSYGVYYGDEEYPCLYPATRIAVLVEVPTWWWFSKTDIGRGYEAWLWPLGAPISIVDVFVSVLSDTVMLPYDYKVSEDNKANKEKGNGNGSR